MCFCLSVYFFISFTGTLQLCDYMCQWGCPEEYGPINHVTSGQNKENKTKLSSTNYVNIFGVCSKSSLFVYNFWHSSIYRKLTMMSPHENAFRITVPLCGESAVTDRLYTRPIMQSFEIFFYVGLSKMLKKQSKLFKTSWRLRDVTILLWFTSPFC